LIQLLAFGPVAASISTCQNQLDRRNKRWNGGIKMKMSKTFTQLGIPFPLFEAPASESSHYVGLEKCALCGITGDHCSKVDYLIATCAQCGTENVIRTGPEGSIICRSCRINVPSPAWREDALACYKCLRAGLAAFTKDTVLGMVTWDQAAEGLTHGVPGLKTNEFELVPCNDNPEWMRAKVSPSLLFELVATPPYKTWQGERWQFCCKRPMIYLGEWKEANFTRNAPNGNGRAFFKKAIIDGVDDSFWGILKNIGGPHMFRCSQCGTLRGHWDMD
jgi:uncharacterized protein CbrC (UPF0167 family)